MPSSDMNTPIGACADQGRGRWIVWAPVFLGLGIGIYFALPWEPSATMGLAGLLGGLAVLFAFRQATPGRLVAWALLAAATGFVAAQLRTQQVAAPAIAERIGPVTVEGRIVALEPLPKGSRVVLDRLRITLLDANQVPERVRLRLNGEQPVLRPGTWVRLRAMLSPPPSAPAPGAFDFQRQAYFQRLGGVGFVMGEAQVLQGERAAGWDRLELAIESLRQDIDHRIRAQLPGDTGGTVSAMVTGVRGGISEATMEDVRDSGLAHLLAISGLNIGLAAALLFVLARGLLALIPAIALRYPIKKWATVMAFAGAGAYALIAGITVPTQRAFLMIAIALVAVLYDRRALSMRLVAVAADAILLVTPENLLGASFQMSFAAVTALIAFYEGTLWSRRLHPGREAGLAVRIGAYVCGVALTTVIATIATAPYSVYHFNRLAAYGLAANMVAVPVTALWIVPWTLAVLVALPFDLQAVPVAMMGLGVDVVIAVAHEVASWPGSSELVPAAPVAALAAVSLGGLWICLASGRWRLAGLAGVAAALALTMAERPPDVLVDDTGRLFAVRGADGSLIVSNRRVGRFNREIWLRRDGLEEADEAWPWDGAGSNGPLACDGLGCIYRTAGRVVAFPRLRDALAEDCWRADVVVSGLPSTFRCRKADTISRTELIRNGAHAIWLDPSGVRIESVNGLRGERPWVIRPPARRTFNTSASGRSGAPEP